MTAIVIEIADAVVAALNGAKLSLPVNAQRYYLPEFDLKDMDTLHVSVVPAELDEEIADRTRDRAEYKIHVAVQQRVAQNDPPGLNQAAIDGLMQLVQDIDDLFRHKPLAGFAPAALVEDGEQADLRPQAAEGRQPVHQPPGVHFPRHAVGRRL